MRIKQFLLLVLIFSVSAFARPVETPLLYKITKDGISSYMLGTIHINVNWEDLPSIVHEHFDNAEMFAMETNLNAMDPVITQGYQYYPEGDSLRNHISEEAFKKLVEELPQIPEEQLEKMKPFLVNAIRIQMMSQESKEKSKNGNGGLDMQIYDAAKESGKTLTYMESWIHQLTVVDRLFTDEALEESLMSEVEVTPEYEEDDSKNTLQLMLDLYRDGDQESLCEIIVSDDEAQNELLLFERNRNWIGLIDMMHYNYKDAFIAVGAGHFCGEQGVFELLNERGYTVERILE